jgi:uncharacterized FlgJ-related protein
MKIPKILLPSILMIIFFSFGIFFTQCYMNDHQKKITHTNRLVSAVDTVDNFVLDKRLLDDLTYNMIIASKYRRRYLTEENIIAMLNDIRIVDKCIAYRIIKKESNFNSQIATTNNNLFGMRRARSRMSTNNGGSNGYATYNTWAMSVIDFYLYTEDCHTLEALIEKLDNNYAENPGYVERLHSISIPRTLVCGE